MTIHPNFNLQCEKILGLEEKPDYDFGSNPKFSFPIRVISIKETNSSIKKISNTDKMKIKTRLAKIINKNEKITE